MHDVVITTCKVPFLPFDFDDARASLGESHGAKRGGDSLFECNYGDAVQWFLHQKLFGRPMLSLLRSMTSGRAVFSMEFDHYDAVPENISQEIQKKYA